EGPAAPGGGQRGAAARVRTWCAAQPGVLTPPQRAAPGGGVGAPGAVGAGVRPLGAARRLGRGVVGVNQPAHGGEDGGGEYVAATRKHTLDGRAEKGAERHVGTRSFSGRGSALQGYQRKPSPERVRAVRESDVPGRAAPGWRAGATSCGWRPMAPARRTPSLREGPRSGRHRRTCRSIAAKRRLPRRPSYRGSSAR